MSREGRSGRRLLQLSREEKVVARTPVVAGETKKWVDFIDV